MLTLHQGPDAESKVQSPGPKSGCRIRSCARRTRRRLHAPRRAPDLSPPAWIETLHSNRNLSPATGKSYEPLTPKHFSFNAPAGACPVCHGLGQKMVFDETWSCPIRTSHWSKGAILPWRRGGKRMVVYYKSMLRGVAEHYQQSLETPYKDAAGRISSGCCCRVRARRRLSSVLARRQDEQITGPFEGVVPNLQRLYQESESEFTRNRLKGFMSPQFCDACNGRRLKPEILAVRLESGGDQRRPPRCAPEAAEGATCNTPPTLSTDRLQPLPSPVSRSWTSAPFRWTGRGILRRAEADGVPGEDRARHHQGNPRPAGFPEERRPGLPDARPRERHLERRRGAAHPAGHADRRRPGGRALYTG